MLPAYLEPLAYDRQLHQFLARYPAYESKSFVYAVDVVGSCNLRCPTCPVANSDLKAKEKMSLELFTQVLEKIEAEGPAERELWLFNWTEPLLHPQIGAMVALAKARGHYVFVSTNLNVPASRIEELLAAQPDRIKVSLSSFDQVVYEQTHVRGNIAKVLDNLELIAKHPQASSVEVIVGHHLYRNTVDQQPRIRAFCAQRGFIYAPSTAIVAPLEKLLGFKMGSIKREELPLVDQLLWDPEQNAAIGQAQRSGQFDCELRFNMMAINHRAEVMLCCGSVEPLGSDFLSCDFASLQAQKYTSAFCKTCMQHNCHLTLSEASNGP